MLRKAILQGVRGCIGVVYILTNDLNRALSASHAGGWKNRCNQPTWGEHYGG